MLSKIQWNEVECHTPTLQTDSTINCSLSLVLVRSFYINCSKRHTLNTVKRPSSVTWISWLADSCHCQQTPVCQRSRALIMHNFKISYNLNGQVKNNPPHGEISYQNPFSYWTINIISANWGVCEHELMSLKGPFKECHFINSRQSKQSKCKWVSCELVTFIIITNDRIELPTFYL